MRNLSDESLLAGLGSGDRDAAAAFVARFQRRVFGLTYSILRDRGAAEEAAQEVFVRAWRHASAYDPRRGTVAAWLLTIARNVSINMLPARRFDPIDPEVLVAMEARTPRGDGNERAGSVETQVVDSEPLREALGRLPEGQRRALVLAVFYGFTAKEMSELDGLPLGTVKTRIRSAMMKLRSELGVPDER
jgi:RNA polymerase sigma factor (sigma-70 family)